MDLDFIGIHIDVIAMPPTCEIHLEIGARELQIQMTALLNRGGEFQVSYRSSPSDCDERLRLGSEIEE